MDGSGVNAHTEIGRGSEVKSSFAAQGIARVLYLVLIIGLAAGLLAFLAVRWNWLVSSSSVQTTDDAYIQADLVPIIAKVPGYVRAMPVQDFQSVERGALLAQLESDDYEARVEQAKADVSAAEAALAVIHSEIDVQQSLVDQARATIDVAKADLTRDKLEADRQQTLLQQGLAGSKQRVEQVVAAQRRSEATVRLSVAQLQQQANKVEVLKAQEIQAKADLESRRAALDLAQIALSETRLIAPRNGVVSRRLVNPGAYVSVGSQLMTLVPLSDVYVIANFKETQVTNMARGQRAAIEVDTFAGVTIDAIVDSISPASGSQFSLLPPDNATGNFTKVVQRIPVKLRFEVDEELLGRLRPGSSVIVKIYTQSRILPELPK